MDDILGLYNERSRSRGGASSLGRSQPHEPYSGTGHEMGTVMPDPPPGLAITLMKNDYDGKYFHNEEQKGGRSSPVVEENVVGYGSYNDSAIRGFGHDRIDSGDSGVEGRVKVNLDNWPLRN